MLAHTLKIQNAAPVAMRRSESHAWKLSGQFRRRSIADADYFAETSYGVDFNHDLGGGTSLRGGVASRGNGFVRADLGVRFNF